MSPEWPNSVVGYRNSNVKGSMVFQDRKQSLQTSMIDVSHAVSASAQRQKIISHRPNVPSYQISETSQTAFHKN